MNRRICSRWVRPTTRPRRIDRPSATNDNPLHWQIDEIERALWCEDPTFLLHVRRLQRVDTAYVLTVFALLAAGSVLVTIGAATSSSASGCVGAIAMVAACLIDRRRGQTLRRSPEDDTNPDRVDRPTGHGDTRYRGR
jgi:hypothetical protein